MMQRPKNKDEYRASLAEAFACVLEEKGLEWKKEWNGSRGAPHNGVTKACYRGINAFWLKLLSLQKGYQDPRWVTMVQIMDKGGKYHPKEKWHLKKGAKATYVEYWYPYDVKAKRALTWEQYQKELANGRRNTEFKLSSRYTAVFNAGEVEGIPEWMRVPAARIPSDAFVEKLCSGMCVKIFTDGGDQAFYSPAQDQIHLPVPESFTSAYAFYATALHELAHATGHASRLNRDQKGKFGSTSYAYEELVAEMCSCFAGANLHTEAEPEHIENHRAYVQFWVQGIREQPETLVRAIRDAQTAACYMDWKAGLISEKEYENAHNSAIAIEVRKKASRELER